MLKVSLLFFLIWQFYSCGLKYEAPALREDVMENHREIVENYIKDAYKDSSITYNSLFFGESVTVKPPSFNVLDSLYEIKYQNEQNGFFDSELEEKIGIQKNVIIQETEKIRYIENHVFAITNNTIAEINFCDVVLNGQSKVTNFKITEQKTIPKEYLGMYEIYLGKESFLTPGYLPVNQEQRFYSMFDEHMNSLTLIDQNKFLIHQLRIMTIALAVKSLDIEMLLMELSTIDVLKREYDHTLDVFNAIDGVLVDKELLNYRVELETQGKKYRINYTPFYEFIDFQLME